MMDYLTPFDMWLLGFFGSSRSQQIFYTPTIKQITSQIQSNAEECESEFAFPWHDYQSSKHKLGIPSNLGNIKIPVKQRKLTYSLTAINKLVKFAIRIANDFADFNFDSTKEKGDMRGKPRLEEEQVLTKLLRWTACQEGAFKPLAINRGNGTPVGLTQISYEILDPKEGGSLSKGGYNFEDINDYVIKRGRAKLFLTDACKFFNDAFSTIKKDAKLSSAKIANNIAIIKNKFLKKVKDEVRFHPLGALVISINIYRDHNRRALIGDAFDTTDIILPYLNKKSPQNDFEQVCNDTNNDKICDRVDVDLNKDEDKKGNSNAFRRAKVQKDPQTGTQWDNFIIARQMLGIAYRGIGRLKNSIDTADDKKDYFNIYNLGDISKCNNAKPATLEKVECYAYEAGYSDISRVLDELKREKVVVGTARRCTEE